MHREDAAAVDARSQVEGPVVRDDLAHGEEHAVGVVLVGQRGARREHDLARGEIGIGRDERHAMALARVLDRRR